MKPEYVWGVVVAMALANYAVRFLPIAVVSRLELPRPIARWLSFVPAAVMSALVAGEIFRPSGHLLAPWDNPYLLAALPTGLVFYKTRSFLGATLAGIVFFLAFRALLG